MLNWKACLVKDYAIAAATIAVHNMWFVQDQDYDKKKAGLQALIARESSKRVVMLGGI